MSEYSADPTRAPVSIGITASLITCVIVVVPARDEAGRIGRCLESIHRSAELLPADIVVTVIVASNDSTDATNGIVESFTGHKIETRLLRGRWLSAGGARRAAAAHGLGHVQANKHQAAHASWIASTDADTTVPTSSLQDQLRYANAGYGGVAGIVKLTDDIDLSNGIQAAFAELYELGPARHHHVHGANIGVRADAYLAAQGFPHIDVAEDHALWNELRRLGRPLVAPVDVWVDTSARLRGRAAGGFADTWATIMGARDRDRHRSDLDQSSTLRDRDLAASPYGREHPSHPPLPASDLSGMGLRSANALFGAQDTLAESDRVVRRWRIPRAQGVGRSSSATWSAASACTIRPTSGERWSSGRERSTLSSSMSASSSSTPINGSSAARPYRRALSENRPRVWDGATEPAVRLREVRVATPRSRVAEATIK